MNSVISPICEKNFFTQVEITEKITISVDKPDISHVLSNILEPEVASIKVISTLSGSSGEGVSLTGLKASIEILVKEKILYVSTSMENTTHIIENKFYKVAYVTLPLLIEGTSPDYLLDHKYLKPRIIVEDASIKPLDRSCLINNINLRVELYYIPTYEVCWSLQSGTASSIFISYADLSKTRQLIPSSNVKCVKPEWSPNGQDIAFLKDSYGSYSLCILNCKKLTTSIISNSSLFSSVTGFTWSCDGLRIAFTAIVDGYKEVFILNTKTLAIKQLTFGKSAWSSFKPRFSPDGKKIAFLRSYGGLTNLYVMDTNGLNTKGLTSIGNINDFTWCPDGNKLAFISFIEDNVSQLVILSVTASILQKINEPSSNYQRKKVKFSPDGKFLSFIGCYLDTDNLFVFDLTNKSLTAITDNHRSVCIDTCAWSIDSSKILFSSNQHGNLGIYSADIKTLEVCHLKNITGESVSLSYRPQIK